MNMLTVHADVAIVDVAGNPEGHPRRVAGMLADNETVAVASTTAGSGEGEIELSFTLSEARRLADACLAGDRRALTTPGLARILSATAAILFRVSHAAGAFQAIEDIHVGDDDLPADRGEAGGDEDSD